MSCTLLLQGVLLTLCVVWCGARDGPTLDYDDENDSDDSEDDINTGSIPSVDDIMKSFKATRQKVNGTNETYIVVDEAVRAHLTGTTTLAVIPALYTLVFAVGLPANALGLWIMATKIRKLPSTVFLINLTTADLLLMLILPFKISYHLQGNNWVFGEALCRTMTAFFYGNMYCSILLLTVISVDRYCALVHPFTSRQFRDNVFAACVCSAIWVITLLLVLPFLFVEQQLRPHNLNITTCHDVLLQDQQTGFFFRYFASLVVVGFLIPCCVTLFCYGSVIKTLMANKKSYTRAAVVTLLILLVYVGCFAPSNVILLIHHSEYQLTGDSDLYIYYMVCLVLSSAGSCIDPFIYYYISDEFRVRVKHVICCSKAQQSSRSGRTTTQELLRTNTTSSSNSRARATVRTNI
ncbi:proteinase-activated receptor 3-like [Amblyraja radiata]|uniref:proteinase-activated receptor 3-like n=1 Tax=Amblyraja radiata TaxID=386614 RepID=UPI0014033358|nr:proteinase-activated receptor 3-like [Amblyraja radiata]